MEAKTHRRKKVSVSAEQLQVFDGVFVGGLNWRPSPDAVGMLPSSFCWQRAARAQALGRSSLVAAGRKHRQKAAILPTPTEATKSKQFASAVL